MVCPNCHSHNIIEVQGQHFCIDCGQALPEQPVTNPDGSVANVQASGLPIGVKILDTTGIPTDTIADATNTSPDATAKPDNPAASADAAGGVIVKARSRMKPKVEDEEGGEHADDKPNAEGSPDKAQPDAKAAPADAKARKRKPGRPKAGPLDSPRPVPQSAPALPEAPQLGRPKPVTPPPDAPPAPTPAPPPAPVAAPAKPTAPDKPLDGPRRMSDIAPRRHRKASKPEPLDAGKVAPAPSSTPEAVNPDTAEPEAKPAQKGKHKALFSWLKPKHKPRPKPKPKPHARHHVHKVGVPPLHFGSVLAFSLRARVRPRHVGLAGLAALTFAGAAGYAVWLWLTQGPGHLVAGLQHPTPALLAQLIALVALYYVGRSIGQAAITYGVAREADQRPASLSRQLGIAVNTFGRRLLLDLAFLLIELTLLAGIVTLAFVGGQTWPVDLQWQMGALFVSFLVLLYLVTAVAITRGLANVALTLTTERPKTAIKLGWRLFSHRFELLGLRFLAAAMELVLALPLAALAVAFIMTAPASLHLAVTLGVAVIAWLAGALFGAGTATWWTSLYRQLVLADHPDGAVDLLSGRHPADANRGPLALLVSVTTILIVAVLVLPLLNLR